MNAPIRWSDDSTVAPHVKQWLGELAPTPDFSETARARGARKVRDIALTATGRGLLRFVVPPVAAAALVAAGAVVFLRPAAPPSPELRADPEQAVAPAVLEQPRQALAQSPVGQSARADTAVGYLRLFTRPLPARVWIDGTEIGVTPLTGLALSPGSHDLRVENSRHAQRQETIQILSGQSTTRTIRLVDPSTPGPTVRTDAGEDASSRVGRLTVMTRPWSRVVVDGRDVGATPQVLHLAPGMHVVGLKNPDLPLRTQAVEIRAGQTTRLWLNLQDPPAPPRSDGPAVTTSATGEVGYLNINTTPWSTVYMGSRLLGQTPLANVEVPAGRHTLVIRREGRGAETTRTVVVPANERVFVRVDLAGVAGPP